VTGCRFQTSSEPSTSLGRVRYQHCVCGRFRVLLGLRRVERKPVRGGPRQPHSRTAVLIPHVSTMTMNLHQVRSPTPIPFHRQRRGKACPRTPIAGWMDCVRGDPPGIEVSDE
jgi:hypothetical protein